MNVLTDLLKEYFTYNFIELLAGLSGLIVALGIYHISNIWLSKKITNKFFCRTTLWSVSIGLYSIYYLMFESGRSIEVRDRDMLIFRVSVISSFVCFNLYYILSEKLNSLFNRLYRLLYFLSMFLMFWLFLASMDLLINYYEDSSRGVLQNWIGNFHLSDKNRIYIFKRNIIFNIIISLEATCVDFLWRYVIRLRQERRKAKELVTLKLKEQLIQAQLDALHAKINPHFLYNSLNSIAGLALIDDQKTRQMAISLSKFFRYSINREKNNLTTVKEEMEMAETYLEIEKVRFEDSLNYEICIDSGLEDFRIPRFILQPLVENAVKHGLKGEKHGLLIRVSARLEKNKLLLLVQDNGLPFADNLEPGYGLKSIYDKLDLLFPGKYEVALFNSPEKQVRIIIET